MLNAADAQFIDALKQDLPSGVIGDVGAQYLEEPRGLMKGTGAVLARPQDVDQVATIIRACHAARVGVVPFGGGTGLVGGQVSPAGNVAPLILSLERMNKLRAVDPIGNVIVAEAGLTLAEVQTAANDVDRLFPLSLASEGSCRIGGNLSTNAGGVQVLRYGNARDLCLGIEAVLPDGSVVNGLKRLRKDNTGYDLRNLLIGAEGTLGVITAAVLKLAPVPRDLVTSFGVVPSPAAAQQVLSMLQDSLDGLVSAFELVHGTGFDFLSETMPEVRLPFASHPQWMILTEVGGSQAANLEPRVMEVLEAALEKGILEDVLVAQSAAQRDAFWAVRENIPEANKRIGAIVSHDISIPIDCIADFIDVASIEVAKLGPLRLNCFGHLGDGNLHFNLYGPKDSAKGDWKHLYYDIKSLVHDLTHQFDGSVSAEHGIGRFKVDDLERYGDPSKLAAMRAIKAALDPVGIMNPGAVLRT